MRENEASVVMIGVRALLTISREPSFVALVYSQWIHRLARQLLTARHLSRLLTLAHVRSRYLDQRPNVARGFMQDPFDCYHPCFFMIDTLRWVSAMHLDVHSSVAPSR